jgi:hypothetical protein
VEDGSKIRFRHDVRCGDHTLKAAFPLLFSIGYNKEALVGYYIWFSNSNLHWNIIFIKLVHDWEVELVTLFFNLLYCLKLKRGVED